MVTPITSPHTQLVSEKDTAALDPILVTLQSDQGYGSAHGQMLVLLSEDPEQPVIVQKMLMPKSMFAERFPTRRQEDIEIDPADLAALTTRRLALLEVSVDTVDNVCYQICSLPHEGDVVLRCWRPLILSHLLFVQASDKACLDKLYDVSVLARATLKANQPRNKSNHGVARAPAGNQTSGFRNRIGDAPVAYSPQPGGPASRPANILSQRRP